MNQDYTKFVDNGCFIYLRTSTIQQNIETQRLQVIKFCADNHFKIIRTFIDAGESGVKDSRPQLNDMLSALRSNECKTLVIPKIDRLARSLKHLLDLLSEFRNRKVRLVSIGYGIDTAKSDDPFMRAFWQLLGIFAELEREISRARVISGLERVKSEGRQLGRPKGSKDKGQRSRSGYLQRYAGKDKEKRKLGKRNKGASNG
jgi:DNA invertase Pin-like site-specific DNA recombinase